MRKFDQHSALIAIELQQLIAEFAHEVDFNSGRNITDFYTEDGTFAVGDYTHQGHAAIRGFEYGARPHLLDQAYANLTLEVVVLDHQHRQLRKLGSHVPPPLYRQRCQRV